MLASLVTVVIGAWSSSSALPVATAAILIVTAAGGLASMRYANP
jgi:hypothetical protein